MDQVKMCWSAVSERQKYFGQNKSLDDFSHLSLFYYFETHNAVRQAWWQFWATLKILVGPKE